MSEEQPELLKPLNAATGEWLVGGEKKVVVGSKEPQKAPKKKEHTGTGVFSSEELEENIYDETPHESQGYTK